MFSIAKNHATIPPPRRAGSAWGGARPGLSAPRRSRHDALLAAYVSEYRPRAAAPPLIRGEDLIRALDLTPSPRFKQILEFVEEERLMRPEMSRSEALEAAMRFQKQPIGDGE